ncbi:hypothetical protein CVT25_007485 [Psilocybe cyanescens]|uniref:Uncharacterized protein n=1 Tax=Psilocybe cyanescens TaxID=93625 RepID=A0A409XVS8_PSICY|nr:hypothetical protein CVT25_007485 [Psilocybe cyanescens]
MAVTVVFDVEITEPLDRRRACPKLGHWKPGRANDRYTRDSYAQTFLAMDTQPLNPKSFGR